MQDDPDRDGGKDAAGRDDILSSIRRIVSEEEKDAGPGLLRLEPSMRVAEGSRPAPGAHDDDEPPLLLTIRADAGGAGGGMAAATPLEEPPADEAGVDYSGGFSPEMAPGTRGASDDGVASDPQLRSTPRTASDDGEPTSRATLFQSETADATEIEDEAEDAESVTSEADLPPPASPMTSADETAAQDDEPSPLPAGVAAGSLSNPGPSGGPSGARPATDPQSLRRAFAPTPVADEAMPRSRKDLEELVRKAIRDELAGPMGERISHNIRLLVAREVARAVEALDEKNDRG